MLTPSTRVPLCSKAIVEFKSFIAGKTSPKEFLYESLVASAAYNAENNADKIAGIPCRLWTPQVSWIRSFDVMIGYT